MNSKAENHNQE